MSFSDVAYSFFWEGYCDEYLRYGIISNPRGDYWKMYCMGGEL
jgi:hypothetical protein